MLGLEMHEQIRSGTIACRISGGPAAMLANQQSVLFRWATLPTLSVIQICDPKVLNGPTRIRLDLSSFIRMLTTRMAPALRKSRIKRGWRGAKQRVRPRRLRCVFCFLKWGRPRRVISSCFLGRFLGLPKPGHCVEHYSPDVEDRTFSAWTD
jgi:hypothetical protein